MNANYRMYSKEVLGYPRNRPPHLVKHCLRKISLANGTDLLGISIASHVVFSVKSVTVNETKRYTTEFGDKKNTSKCTCQDWNLSYYQCKHFLSSVSKVSRMAMGCVVITIYQFSLLHLG